MTIESIDGTDPVEVAKAEVETALENLESAVIDEKIEDAKATANTAANIALDASVNVSVIESEVTEIHDELEHHEESDAWLRQQVGELSAKVTSLQDELSILKASLVVAETPPLPEATQEAVEELLTETLTSPETLTETSSTTRTEVLPESEAVVLEAETPALEVVERKRRILV